MMNSHEIPALQAFLKSSQQESLPEEWRSDAAQRINYFSIQLLEVLGNEDPTQEQIAIVESLLTTYSFI